jgi:glycosyltransferase involved in cell wall biosynthesis
VATLGELRRRGIAAELTHIGAHHRALRREHVRTLGPLRIGNEQHASAHRDAIRATHLAILPSSGEAFGVAPAESAMFGRPAVVSAAGGLPTVVRHDDTGIVLPVHAGAVEWADAIERLVDQPERYRRYAVAARARAWNEFTWDRWGERVEKLLRRAIEEREAPAAAEDRAIA